MTKVAIWPKRFYTLRNGVNDIAELLRVIYSSSDLEMVGFVNTCDHTDRDVRVIKELNSKVAEEPCLQTFSF